MKRKRETTFCDVPKDILLFCIAPKLSLFDIVRLTRTCKTLHAVFSSEKVLKEFQLGVGSGKMQIAARYNDWPVVGAYLTIKPDWLFDAVTGACIGGHHALVYNLLYDKDSYYSEANIIICLKRGHRDIFEFLQRKSRKSYNTEKILGIAKYYNRLDYFGNK